MTRQADLDRIRANLRAELDGAALYRAIAAAERDPGRRDVLLELSRAETQHAAHWRDKLREAGGPDDRRRYRARRALAPRRFGQ